MFIRDFIILHCILVITMVHRANSIKCFSCDSKRDKRCSDPFDPNFNSSVYDLNLVDCSKEVSTRQFISYFSNVMSALGVSANFDSKIVSTRIKEGSQPSACQKVEIFDNNELIVIRNCAILSEIVCDTLKNDSRSDSSTTFCEVCDTDYCNNAQKLFISWNLLCLIVLTNRVIV